MFLFLIFFFTSHQQSFSYKGMGLPDTGEARTLSQVKHSTIEPLSSHNKGNVLQRKREQYLWNNAFAAYILFCSNTQS